MFDLVAFKERGELAADQVGTKEIEIRQNWEGVWCGGKAMDFSVGQTWVEFCLYCLCDVGQLTVAS